MITPEEATQLLPQVADQFDELVAMYDEARYPPAVYFELCHTFSQPDQVQPEDISKALRWKYGRLNHANIPQHQANAIAMLANRWNEFRQADGHKERLEALAYRPNSAFVSRVFLLHLTDPTRIPIVDRYNHLAVRHLLGTVREQWRTRRKPRVFEDVQRVQCFIERIREVWGDGEPGRILLDRYLMMFGKHVVA